MSEQESENKDKQEIPESLFKWVIRYVLIPLTVAALGGWVVLEAVNVEVAARNNSAEHNHDDIVADIFATLTAVAPQTQAPNNTPVIEPTPTEKSSSEDKDPAPTATPAIAAATTPPCGLVPAGWQPYTVQPGNTLFSLAQQTGTTVAAIRQANCLYGQLAAYSQIWLPNIVVSRPEPTATNTPTHAPTVLRPTATATATMTATATATEPPPTPLPGDFDKGSNG
ncbi:MAG: hypothetical protein CL608_18630 [Anaerolineaceae bacterium]|nr:hypothetical protein [Anaerolineaceae bacterium]